MTKSGYFISPFPSEGLQNKPFLRGRVVEEGEQMKLCGGGVLGIKKETSAKICRVFSPSVSIKQRFSF